MELVLIRHGESIWNRENLFTGWHDVDLSDRGRREADDAGRWLKEAGFDFDLCYTSHLKRAVHTLNRVLDQLDRNWLPVVKSWRLNERHYGTLQGLNKAETAEKYGEEQVNLWRRSFDVPPPAMKPDDPKAPRHLQAYRDVNPEELPLAESLKDTIQRALPYYQGVIEKEMLAGKRVMVVSHGNALRALVKHLDGLSDEQITGVNIPTGAPLVYEFDGRLKVLAKRYLGNQREIADRLRQAGSIAPRTEE